jgi:hypothetical protein
VNGRADNEDKANGKAKQKKKLQASKNGTAKDKDSA